MTIEHSPQSANPASTLIFESPERRTVASYERELIRLRATLAQEEVLLHQKDELMQRQEVLGKESAHRLMNDLQMVVSALSLQSQRSANAEVASQLAVAANRIAVIGRIHQRLHSFDGVQAFSLKQYLEGLCRDFSTMRSSGAEQVIVVEGIDIELPTVTGIPLGFIVNELITNAAKHGKGRITVRLEPNLGKGYALSVTNDGPVLPDGFDPAACKGLGLNIIRSLVVRIGGELRIGRGDDNQGAQFTVLFC